MSPERFATEVHDFEEIIQTSIGGRLPLIVGGHAVNIWALSYLDRIGNDLSAFQPFTSKDLDLFGTRELLDRLHEKFGGRKKLSEPRNPVVGSIEVTLHGKTRMIEVLHSICGLVGTDFDDSISLIVGSLRALVLSPQKLLKAKISNVATLDQTNRNDVKHLRMIILCLHEFITDFLSGAEAGEIEPRAVVNLLEETRTITGSAEARKAATRWGIDYEAVWPRERLEKSPVDKVRNFVTHRLSRVDPPRFKG